jgi:hypothetical protein
MKKAHQFPKTAHGSDTSTVDAGGSGSGPAKTSGGMHKANTFPTTAFGTMSKSKKKKM